MKLKCYRIGVNTLEEIVEEYNANHFVVFWETQTPVANFFNDHRRQFGKNATMLGAENKIEGWTYYIINLEELDLAIIKETIQNSILV